MALYTLTLHNWTFEGLQPVAAWNWAPSTTEDSTTSAQLEDHRLKISQRSESTSHRALAELGSVLALAAGSWVDFNPDH